MSAQPTDQDRLAGAQPRQTAYLSRWLPDFTEVLHLDGIVYGIIGSIR